MVNHAFHSIKFYAKSAKINSFSNALKSIQQHLHTQFSIPILIAVEKWTKAMLELFVLPQIASLCCTHCGILSAVWTVNEKFEYSLVSTLLEKPVINVIMWGKQTTAEEVFKSLATNPSCQSILSCLMTDFYSCEEAGRTTARAIYRCLKE